MTSISSKRDTATARNTEDALTKDEMTKNNASDSSIKEVEAMMKSSGDVRNIQQNPVDCAQSTAVGAIVARFELRRASSTYIPLHPPSPALFTVMPIGRPDSPLPPQISGKTGKFRSPTSLKMQALVSSFVLTPSATSISSSSRKDPLETAALDSTILLPHQDSKNIDFIDATTQIRGAKIELEKRTQSLQDELRSASEEPKSSLTSGGTRSLDDAEEPESEFQRMKHELSTLQLAYSEQMEINQIEIQKMQIEVKKAQEKTNTSVPEVSALPVARDGSYVSIVPEMKQGDIGTSERAELKRLEELEKKVLSFILDFDGSAFQNDSCDMTVQNFLDGRGVEISRNRRIERETLLADNKKVNDEIASMRQVLSAHERINGIRLELCPECPDSLSRSEAGSDFRFGRLVAVPEYILTKNINEGGTRCEESYEHRYPPYGLRPRNAYTF